MNNNPYMDSDTLAKLVENMYDEIIIYDNNYRIIYINGACRRHYQYKKTEMIGKTFFEFTDAECWFPSVLPYVYENKVAKAIKQCTYIGTELLTIAVPIFDNCNNITHVIMNVRDTINKQDLYQPSIENVHYELDKSDIIAKSSRMKKIISLIDHIKDVETTIILTGESGTGKSMFAKYIHSQSNRKEKPFINVNCAAIPSELIESELFGYVKGAFTGASNIDKQGLICAADTGTLLLDEVSELSHLAQAKLLTVLQEREVTPVGSVKSQKVDVRIIATTNKDLKELIKLGKFREDLYFRLYTIEISIPPLRKRREDIIPLTLQFLDYYNKHYNLTKQFSSKVLAMIATHEWPGNTRELKHFIERMIVMEDSMVVDSNHMPKDFFLINDEEDDTVEASLNDKDYSLENALDEYERLIVLKAYKNNDSSRKLAKNLKISQSKASRLIQKYIN